MLSPQSPLPNDGISLETTRELLVRAHGGDREFLAILFERCLPLLRRWARGWLPPVTQQGAGAEEFVEQTVLHTLNQLPALESTRQGALQAFLRQALADKIRDEMRQVQRGRTPAERVETLGDAAQSPLEHAVGRDGLERYEQALERLSPRDREAIVARLELRQSYDDVARALGEPHASAARMAVTRALARLVEEMDHGR